MNKDLEKVIDAAVDGSAGFVDILTDHIVEKMKAEEKEIDKDTETGKQIVTAIAELAEMVWDAASDHYVDLLGGKGFDLKRDKENAVKIMDKLVETADFYYGKITDRILERVEKGEKDIEADKEIVKEITGKIFAMTEAMAQGKKKQALELYYDLISLQERPLGILYMIQRQFHFLLLVKEMKKNGNRVTIEGNANLEILYFDREKKKIDVKKIELPYQKTFESTCEDINISFSNLEYILRENGQLDIKTLLKVTCDEIKHLDLNLITKIEQTDVRNIPVASLVIYYVQPGDTLWNIAKKFKTTVELIKSSNNLKDDTILPGQQLIMPKVVDKVLINPLD